MLEPYAKPSFLKVHRANVPKVIILARLFHFLKAAVCWARGVVGPHPALWAPAGPSVLPGMSGWIGHVASVPGWKHLFDLKRGLKPGLT